MASSSAHEGVAALGGADGLLWLALDEIAARSGDEDG